MNKFLKPFAKIFKAKEHSVKESKAEYSVPQESSSDSDTSGLQIVSNALRGNNFYAADGNVDFNSTALVAQFLDLNTFGLIQGLAGSFEGSESESEFSFDF